MPDATQLSEAKRALLDRYAHRERLQSGVQQGNIPRRELGCVVPLSFGQQGLWYVDQLVPGSAAYNVPSTIRVLALLDPWVLQQSINELVKRHEALRTTCKVVDGQPMQVIASSLTVPLPVVDLLKTPPAELEAEARRLAIADAARAFHVSEGPLLRTTLLRLAPDDHLLLLTMHHVISDEWSLGVFLQELTALYEAFSHGKPSPLPDLPIQFADFSLWQRQRLRGPTLDNQLAYWQRQLEGAPRILQLHTDHPRPPANTFRGAQYTHVLPQTFSAELKKLSRREGVTFFMVLLAAFQALLYRYTGQDDLLVGSPIAGRVRPESEQLIGFLVNTIVMRADLSGDPTFREFLGRVRDVAIEAYGHQDVPFEMLVQALAPEREPNRSPLVQVVMTLEPPLPTLAAGWSLEDAHVANGASKFDLTLEIEDRADSLICHWEYSTDLFEESTIARMAGHWHMLLEGIVADPGQRLSQLPLLTEAERQQLLVDWNTTQRDYPRERCLHQLIEAQVERAPEAIAVVYEGHSLTYRELNARANQLAHYLQSLGVGPDVPVGLCVERSLELVVSLLAILKAGGAYVPLDPSYPQERLAYMLEDAEAPLLVTQTPLLGRVRVRADVQVVCLDADGSRWAGLSATLPSSDVSSEHLAYIIYTSGSTGKPKGVQIPHRGLVNLLLSMRQQPGLTAADTMLAVTTISFDIAGLELYLPLLVGARVQLVPGNVAANGSELATTLARTGATVMQATPATWRLLLAAGWQGDRRLTILCGGEALPPDLARELLQRVGALWNVYGPTETTIWSTLGKIETAEPPVSIGRPLANTQIYILDPSRNPTPIGVPGELYIGGDGQARGYRNQPELTSERFIAHPFSDEPGARLYATGDLARYRTDGTIECLGRLDHQVKIRGFRIELGEIESVLRTHPAIAAAVVVAREDVPGDKRLVAYLVVRAGHEFVAAEVRSFLKAQLPDYMAPTAFVPLDALPLTPNGKVNRQVLPAPTAVNEEHLEEVTGVTDAALPMYHQLMQIWEELLDVRPIRVTDDFFDLGGHSLLAARLVEQIEQVFGKKIPLATLSAGATIEYLARVLGQQPNADIRPPTVKNQEVSAKSPFFFLHGDYRGGDPLWCMNLVRALGPNQPLRLLQPGRLEDRLAPTLETFAATHVAMMRSLQPEGPYFLGGWCNGALVAYEMAQQLYAQGQTVDLLVLMETGFATPLERHARTLVGSVGDLLGLRQSKQLDWYIRALRVSNYALRALRSASYRLHRGNVGYLVRRGSAELRKGISLARPLVQRSGHDSSDEDTLARSREDYLDIFSWMAVNYLPRPYPGQVTLFWSQEEPLDGPSRSMGWRIAAKAAQMAVHIIRGDHLTCRTEHVHILAEHLKGCLSQAQATDREGQQRQHVGNWSTVSRPSQQRRHRQAH
jgi:amino acid adenylation domain-containing protein